MDVAVIATSWLFARAAIIAVTFLLAIETTGLDVETVAATLAALYLHDPACYKKRWSKQLFIKIL